MSWMPMTANEFPWPHKDVIIVAYHKDSESDIDVFRCTCAEHGAYFLKDGGMLSLNERGWIPFAFRADDTPDHSNPAFPPMLTDYLTTEIEDP